MERHWESPWQALKVAIARRARVDPLFRMKLLATPRRVIKEVLGVDLPPGIALHMKEEAPRTLYLTVPPSAEPPRGRSRGRGRSRQGGRP
ncbi:hypothetical protein HRD49_32670 [Corallococcus exiguus]|uniref:hypothetical protein n=1 Tax=Corallococcus TaxID=83461 RepID=UPI0013157204|nr:MULTISPECIES: hypothetical protein [Corallococcus]NRD66515.1 hypothetical protein [Corallococcus exiguus]